jgi:hypothetical protein
MDGWIRGVFPFIHQSNNPQIQSFANPSIQLASLRLGAFALN